MSIKKIKVISRNPDHYMRETKHDLYKVQRNFDPDLHPFKFAREYKQALNAVKLERVFAKPFIGNLDHSESVCSLCAHPRQLSCMFSGTVEGELYMWNLRTQKNLWKIQAHDGRVHSISAVQDGKTFFTVGNDKTIKQWSVDKTHERDLPDGTWFSDSLVTGITHHHSSSEFITCGERVLLWDINSKSPKNSFDWGTSKNPSEPSVVCVKLNKVEQNLFISSDHANNIILYDTRARNAVNKVKMKLRVNALEWNPMEAFIFSAASEDYNAYTFDIRKMDQDNRIIAVHKGHTSAVLDLSYSPTGKEFCTGSYDRSIRMFKVDETNSREVYHSKRMFRISCVLWSADSKFILSGSSDHNVRLWKANASENIAPMRRRQQDSQMSANAMKEAYKNFPEIKRIARHRHLPKHLYHSKKELLQIHEAARNKESNVRKHSRPGSVRIVPAIEKPIADKALQEAGPSEGDNEEEMETSDEES